MAKIKKVVIEAGGKEFNLTVEEAIALRNILNATFPEAKITYWPTPIIIERYPQPYTHYPWKVSYDSGGAVYCTSYSGNSITL